METLLSQLGIKPGLLVPFASCPWRMKLLPQKFQPFQLKNQPHNQKIKLQRLWMVGISNLFHYSYARNYNFQIKFDTWVLGLKFLCGRKQIHCITVKLKKCLVFFSVDISAYRKKRYFFHLINFNIIKIKEVKKWKLTNTKVITR